MALALVNFIRFSLRKADLVVGFVVDGEPGGGACFTVVLVGFHSAGLGVDAQENLLRVRLDNQVAGG